MKTTLKTLALVASSALVLSGCSTGEIYPLANPQSCDGNAVSLRLDNSRPVVLGDESLDSDIKLDVLTSGNNLYPDVALTEEDSPASGKVFIRYEVGLSNELGFSTLDESFLDLFLVPESIYHPSASPEPSPSPVPTVSSVFSFFTEMDGGFSPVLTGASTTGSLIEILGFDGSETFDFVTPFVLPGVFVARCGAPDGPIVASTKLFPNLRVLTEAPTFSQDDLGDLFLTLPDEIPVGSGIFILGFEDVWTETVASDFPTEIWTKLFSIPVSDDLGPQVGIISTIESEELLIPLSEDRIVPLEEISSRVGGETTSTYRFMILIDGESYFQTAFYDVNVSDNGIEDIVPSEGAREPIKRASIPTVVTESVKVSTKGHRLVSIEGTGFQNVMETRVNGLSAKAISTNYFRMDLRLPKQPAGKFDLVLRHQRGDLLMQKFATYYKSSRIGQLQVAAQERKALWSPRVKQLLTSSKKAVQVDCVARVPAGTKAAPVKKKAAAVCASVNDNSIKTRVVVKRAPAGSIASVAVKLWD